MQEPVNGENMSLLVFKSMWAKLIQKHMVTTQWLMIKIFQTVHYKEQVIREKNVKVNVKGNIKR